MKKYFVFAAMALATFMNYSCSEVDKPGSPTTDVFYLDGKDYVANVVGTFQGEVGSEVSLTLGVHDPFDVFAVDFGDGKLIVDTVCYQNKGLLDEEGITVPWRTSATTFKGTVAGKGIVTVYGNSDLWYMDLKGGIAPTTFNQTRFMKLVQLLISGANMEKVELPQFEELTQFSFTNSPVKSIDVSKATALTRIDIYNVTDSKFEPQLKEIDLSKNVNLETVVLGGTTYKKGELTQLDFTNNTKLTQISVQNNKLTSVTGIAPTVKNIYLNDNELASLTFPEFTIKGTIQIPNNKFTLATLPTKPSITSASKYTYVPQPAYEVPETVTELDLSSQLTATGVLAEPVETTYSFVTASGTTLVAGTDYEVTAPGKFKFLTAQTEKVHGVMATLAFPKFTGNNAYKTTEFTVNVAE